MEQRSLACEPLPSVQPSHGQRAICDQPSGASQRPIPARMPSATLPGMHLGKTGNAGNTMAVGKVIGRSEEQGDEREWRVHQSN